jgi:putative membrane protein
MRSDKLAYKIIGILSALVFIFLTWLIYFKPAAETSSTFVSYLPILNAFLNSLTSIFLIFGYMFIRDNRIDLHKKMMLTATFTSFLFLISYITYHHFHGDSKFLGVGFVRIIYFFILISHIVLSAVQVPLILTTLYLAFTGNSIKHKKVARITFPIWLYVSITGVLIFIFLNLFN